MADHNEANEGFPQELWETFTENRDMVVDAADRILGNTSDAEDVAHTVFVRLLERRELQPQFCKNPRGYLYRAAINEAYNLIAARGRQKLADGDIDAMNIPAAEADSPPEEDVERVRSAMAKMIPEAVEILELYYNDGFSCLEIADLKSKNVVAVYQQLRRARVELKKWLLTEEKPHETEQEKNERTHFQGDAEASQTGSKGNRRSRLAAARG